jgi:hypothetical protein
MDRSFQKYWNKLFWKFKISQAASLLLLASSVTLIAVGITSYLSIKWPDEFSMVYFILVLFTFSIWSSFWSFSRATLKDRMHQLYPELEYSLHLFLEVNASALAELQKEKIIQKLPLITKVPLPENWFKLLGIGVISIAFYFFGFKAYDIQQISIPEPVTYADSTEIIKIPEKEVFNTGKTEITIVPPPYTNMKIRIWEKDLKIPEGSKLTFSIKGGNTIPRLIQQGTDTLELSQNKKEWNRSFWLTYATAFQLYFQKEDSIINEKVLIFELLKDQKPIIITDLDENRKIIQWSQLKNTFDMQLQLRDDYGLTQANIIATLSKGDGEAVKFRELKWALPQFREGLKRQDISYQLRMDTLGLDPGDELYFYIELFDNKYPENQLTKSEVYFIEVADTVQQESVAFEGLALSTEPEFFKSQRQIIIDTEKLIKNQNILSRAKFEDKSDEIGSDQKILRLRYGIFLGEEYESKGGMGESAGEEEDHSGHDHGEGEHHDENLGAQPNESNFSNDLYNSPELEAYVHSHDNSQIATFFDAEVKKKLKEALANMWEAELYLRTYRPKMAIPYEYKALELIKEVQRASRIYVQRMGFEPPPLEPDKKRLTGNLEDIQPNTGTYITDSEPFWSNLSETVREMRQISNNSHSTVRLKLIQELGELIIAEIIENPVRYAQILAEINQYRQSPSMESFNRIIHLTEQILPVPEQEIKGVQTNNLQLKSIFHQQLQQE